MSTSLRLQTCEARKKLPKRSEPYWLEVSRGRYIGYRRGATGGFWLLREHCQGMGKKGAYIKRRLGPADDDGPVDGMLSWDDARKLADGEERPTVTVPGRFTVAQAADTYFATRSATGEQDEMTFAAFIAPKLGRKPVAELTTGDIESWLAAQVPATADREARRAAQATVLGRRGGLGRVPGVHSVERRPIRNAGRRRRLCPGPVAPGHRKAPRPRTWRGHGRRPRELGTGPIAVDIDMNHVPRTAAVVHRYLPFQSIIGQEATFTLRMAREQSGRRTRPNIVRAIWARLGLSASIS